MGGGIEQDEEGLGEGEDGEQEDDGLVRGGGERRSEGYALGEDANLYWRNDFVYLSILKHVKALLLQEHL